MTSISPDNVRDQLKRILASPEFSAGKRFRQFLRYVVEQSLNGQSESIKQYNIAVEALGYGVDFDPLSNPAIRILARRLRRALDQYYNTHGIEDSIRIDIPKGGYVPDFTKNHNPAQFPDSKECATLIPSTTPLGASTPSIAVIMFTCLNSGDTFDHLATGLTEEIIIALTPFQNFLVVGPLAREAAYGTLPNIRRIAQKYGVRFVLDGTLRVEGEKVRLTIRLADTVNGQQLWGQTLNVKLHDRSLMAFEKDVVGHVTAIIADNYGIIPRRLSAESHTKDVDAKDGYEAVLRFYHYCRVLTPDSYARAVEALEKTIQANPDHALALAARADLVASSYWFGYEEDDSNLQRAETMARRAVDLDHACLQAHSTMAMVHFLKHQKILFLDAAEQTLQLNPNHASNLAFISLFLGMVGQWERALSLMDKAMRLNPQHPGWYHILGFMNHYRQGEYDRAWIEAQRFNTPDFFWDPLIRAAALGQLDRRKKARKAVDDLLALVPDFISRGPSLIRRMVYLEEQVEMLVAGLRKAGLKELKF